MAKQQVAVVPELSSNLDDRAPYAICDLFESENLRALLALRDWLKGKVDII